MSYLLNPYDLNGGLHAQTLPGSRSASVEVERVGNSYSQSAARAGLPRDLFEQPRILVSTSELFALWRAIETVSSDPLIGLKLGVENKTERFHPMAIAALSTQNFVAATEHLARYKKLTAPEEILSELDEDEFSISFRWLLAVDAEPKVLPDYCFAWMVSLARHGTATRLNPIRVNYLQERANLRALERHFGCAVKGGAPRNEIRFRSSDATAPFVTRNAELFDMLAPQFEEQLRQYTDEDSFIELVRRAIQDRLTGHRPSIETVSQALHLSPRTLQRRLQDQAHAISESLMRLATPWLAIISATPALELNEAAYLLGFEDPNSFGRAFRTWEGIPPSDWRETHQKSRPEYRF